MYGKYETLINNDEIFKVKLNTDAGFANNLRKKIHNTGGYAIFTISFFVNNTFTPDELISHRLCQLPILKQEKFNIELDFTAEKDRWLSTNDISEYLPKDCNLFKLTKGQRLKLSICVEKGNVEEDIRYMLGTAYYTIENNYVFFTTESFGQLRAEELFKQNYISSK